MLLSLSFMSLLAEKGISYNGDMYLDHKCWFTQKLKGKEVK